MPQLLSDVHASRPTKAMHARTIRSGGETAAATSGAAAIACEGGSRGTDDQSAASLAPMPHNKSTAVVSSRDPARGFIRDTPTRRYPASTGKINVLFQHDGWHLSNHNLRTLVNAEIASLFNAMAIRCVVNDILEKPWLYRTQFIVARCRELDAKE